MPICDFIGLGKGELSTGGKRAVNVVDQRAELLDRLVKPPKIVTVEFAYRELDLASDKRRLVLVQPTPVRCKGFSGISDCLPYIAEVEKGLTRQRMVGELFLQ